MKKHLVLLLLWIISFPNFGQTGYFNKIIDPSPVTGANHIVSMVRNDTSIFALVGHLPDTGWQQANCFLHLNLAGVVLNNKLHFIPNHTIGSFAVNSLINDGTGLVSIGTLSDTNNLRYGYIVKTNYDLDTIWSRTHPHPDAASIPVPPQGLYSVFNFHVIRPTPDGGYIVAGRYNPNYIAGNNLVTFLLKTDSLGNKEWLKTYPGLDKTFSIEVTQLGGFVFTAFGNGFNLVATDSIGNIQWRTTLPQTGAWNLSGNVKQFTNGDFAVVASPAWQNPAPGVYSHEINLFRINPAGDILFGWNKKFRPFHSVVGLTLHQWLEMQILPDQSIVIMGNARVLIPELHPSTQYKGFLMKLNPSGDSVWARHYNYGKWEDWSQFYGMVQTDDGGFMVGGLHINFQPGTTNNASIWLVKTDSLGCDTPGCHLISIEERVLSIQELEVFPNPFEDEMHIVLPEEFGAGMLVLYDVNGCKALETRIQTSVTGQTVAIQTGSFKPGVYLLELNGKDGKIWRRKVMKH